MQRRSLLLAAGTAAAAFPFIGRPARAQAGSVVGAGSALSGAVFQKWTELAKSGANLRVTYEQNGGAQALEQLKQRTIDFASVDYPRRAALLREHRLIQFPTVVTGVVPFVNLPGIADGQLRLTGELLADIFLGKITKWSDAKIKAQNSGVALPDIAILPTHRAESSGANMLFSTYLTRVSEAWAAGPSAGTVVQWPANVGFAAEGRAALAAKVKGTPGAIGFGGPALVKEIGLASVSMQNRAGELVKANAASFTKAAENADWTTPAFTVDLVDQDAPGVWPICGANFVLVPENPTAEKVEAARNTFKFFDWAYKNGDAVATEFVYPPVPQSAHDHVIEVWRRAKDPSGRPIWEA